MFRSAVAIGGGIPLRAKGAAVPRGAAETPRDAIAIGGSVVPRWDPWSWGRRDRTHPTPGNGAAASSAPNRLAALAAALLIALFAIAFPAAPASAHDGCLEVTVVVDFGTLADDPATGCAVDPANGLDALAQAGFAVAEVASIRGMVCRIDELPESSCGGAPPAKEYWSYWRADADSDEWSYSHVGGADAHPNAGDVEGWVFGDGSMPPALAPIEAAESTEGRGPDADDETSFTWIVAATALVVIAGLVLWRMRRDRNA